MTKQGAPMISLVSSSRIEHMFGTTKKESDPAIIVAYDGSSNSKDALQLGNQLCEALGANPLIAYCVSFPGYLMDSVELGLTVDRMAKPVLDEAAFEMDNDAVPTRQLFDESPARALAGLAEEMNPAALVIGSAHSGLFGRVKTGRVGKQLLSAATCPIAVAPQGYTGDHGKKFSKICVAIDEGSQSQHALAKAGGIASALGLPLTIVSVLEPLSYSAVQVGAAADLGLIQTQVTAEILEDAAEQVPNDVKVELVRLEGYAGQVLADYSDECDLMILGSRGFGPLRRVLLGSVSSHLMGHARCPLLVVPRASEKEVGSDPPRQVASVGEASTSE